MSSAENIYPSQYVSPASQTRCGVRLRPFGFAKRFDGFELGVIRYAISPSFLLRAGAETTLAKSISIKEIVR